MTTEQQDLEEAVKEWEDLTREMLDKEVMEFSPPPPPFDQSGPPYETMPRLDSRTITRHVLRTCNDDPLFTDPEYGKRTRYGCQIAPGTILGAHRQLSVHGALQPDGKGVPFFTFYSGTAYEFFDVVRVGSKFRVSQVLREMFDKHSNAQGRMIFLVPEHFFWDFHGDLIAKAYCTEIMVPREGRHVEQFGQQNMYDRGPSSYTPEEIEEAVRGIEAGAKRRGAEPRYWEDVEIGDELVPFVYRTHSLYDMWANRAIGPGGPAYEVWYRTRETKRTYPVRTHPVTRWPYSGNAEHPDPVLAPYRGQPTSFDNGPERVQIVPQLIYNWMGDDGFLHRVYMANRRPVYYGDTVVYTGEVVKKFKRTHRGEEGPGAAAGEAEYCAVGIRIASTSPAGTPVEGTATVYLPSRESGPVRLPIPHEARPPHVPYDTYRRDWY